MNSGRIGALGVVGGKESGKVPGPRKLEPERGEPGPGRAFRGQASVPSTPALPGRALGPSLAGQKATGMRPASSHGVRWGQMGSAGGPMATPPGWAEATSALCPRNPSCRAQPTGATFAGSGPVQRARPFARAACVCRLGTTLTLAGVVAGGGGRGGLQGGEGGGPPGPGRLSSPSRWAGARVRGSRCGSVSAPARPAPP